MKYLSVEEMIAVEKAADRAGHTYPAMMEAAGKGLAEIIDRKYGSYQDKTILALVGSGNNGGDALVALDYLLAWGWTAAGVLLRPRDPQDDLIERMLQRGGELLDCSDPVNFPPDLKDRLAKITILLDGVLGTGIRLPLRKPLDQLLNSIQEVMDSLGEKPLVVAVDCPSGVDCDSGAVSSCCIPADLTVTMAGVKQGLLRFPAYNYVGELVVVDIGLPGNLPEWEEISREVIEEEWVRQVIPERPLNAHKGTFGTSLIIAGSQAYPGAAMLAGVSAYRIGAGLVTMAVPQGIYQPLVTGFPEGTWIVLDCLEGGIAESALSSVQGALGRPTGCLIGPGLGQLETTAQFLKGFIHIADLPTLIVDADGLRLLARLNAWSDVLPQGSILTPHPGELAAMSGLHMEDIQANRVLIAERFAKEWGQIIVLKGAHTVIANPDGRTRILISADPALARAGSGDVLAGIICGLVTQGVAPFDAAAAGAWVHARAGKTAALLAGSPAAVLAGEISGAVGKVLADLQEG